MSIPLKLVVCAVCVCCFTLLFFLLSCAVCLFSSLRCILFFLPAPIRLFRCASRSLFLAFFQIILPFFSTNHSSHFSVFFPPFFVQLRFSVELLDFERYFSLSFLHFSARFKLSASPVSLAIESRTHAHIHRQRH